MTRSCYMVILFMFGLAWPVKGTSFMPRQEEVESTLLNEFAATLRPGANKDHIIKLEARLEPMYDAVPREADGRLSPLVVRYVLHRFFAQRGWFIVGLEPGNNGAGNSTSGEDSTDLKALQEWVPSYMTAFLQKMSGGKGTSLRELAILAGTLEDLIHKETVARLNQSFEALELPMDAKLAEKDVSEVLEVFMMIYMLGGDFSVKGPTHVRHAHNVFVQKLNDWSGKQEWMQRVLKSLYPNFDLGLDFKALSGVAEEIGARYGEYNKLECRSLKDTLLEMESQKAGRVRLPDFYKKSLDGVFEFNEKIEYLRALGAVDETDPKNPLVIISNYVASRPNCFDASSFYVVCCPDQCEPLMGKLENAIASEMGLPEQIMQLVSALSSETVTAPRKLSPTLVRHLDSIAKSNAGQVPLHGRLFAQWMHHAFPRECPFPHEGGANPQTADEWLHETGETSKVSTEDLKAHVEGDTEQKPKGAAARRHHDYVENELQWSAVEKPLLPFGHSARSQPRSTLRAGAVLSMVLSMACGLVYATKVLLAGTDEQKCLPNLGFGQASADFEKVANKML